MNLSGSKPEIGFSVSHDETSSSSVPLIMYGPEEMTYRP
jgi:hypothetical protein